MRFAVTVLLWLLTTAALAVAVPAVWTQKNVIDPDGYVAMAEKAANDPALRAAVASALATRAMALIKQRGYAADSAEVHAVAAAYAAGPSFPPHFADANRLVHSWIFAGTGAQSEDHQLVINVAPMLNDPVFDPLLIRLDVAVPSDVTVPVTVLTPKVLQPGKLRPLATWGLWLSVIVAALTGICALWHLRAADFGRRAQP